MKKFLTLVVLAAAVFALSEKSLACDCEKNKKDKKAHCDKKNCSGDSCGKDGDSCSAEVKK